MKQAKVFFDLIYRSGLWISACDTAKASIAGNSFCEAFSNLTSIWMRSCLHLKFMQHFSTSNLPTSKEAYAHMASLTYDKGQKLFKLRPKLHFFWELTNTLACSRGVEGMSPLATCTWSDEDYIGRVSRIARSCHSTVASMTTIRKVMGVYSRQFEKTLGKK